MMGEGQHLFMDALARENMKRCWPSPITEAQVKDFVSYMPMPKYLNMTIVEGPHVKSNGHGWVGWCIIAESHVTMHTEGIEVHADIYSCKPFDPQTVIAYCKDELGLEQINARCMGRGFAVHDQELVLLEV